MPSIMIVYECYRYFRFAGSASCSVRRSRIISSTSAEVVPKTSSRISLAVCSSRAFLSRMRGKTCRSILGLLCKGHPSSAKTPAIVSYLILEKKKKDGRAGRK